MIKAHAESRQTPMGMTYVTVSLNAAGHRKKYQTNFLVDTGATDTLAPAEQLRKIGIKPVGRMAYEMADGSLEAFEFGLAEITFMGEITAGRVIFGPDGVEPLLGVTALESVGIVVDATNRTLKRLPAIPLK
jgi:clan AA aspartic protease